MSDSRSDPARREVQKAYRKAHRHPWLRRGSIVIAGGLAVLLAVGVAGYFKLSGNISTVDVSKELGKRPVNRAVADKVTGLTPMNILVMGVDTRNLGTTKYGTTPGDRSDTNLLVHLSGDRKSATVVSIPRDSMVHAPSDCKNPNTKVLGGPLRMWNANYGLGGPACVIRTLEGNTGITVDHFMVVNFLGFKSMVDGLGTVEVCLPEAVNDPMSQLHLPAGRSQVNGEQALSFVRVRHNIGNDGSDLGRINRQQAFLSSMVQEATSSKLLFRPDRLFRFLDAATKSLATDPGLANLNAMREVAQSMVGLKMSQIRFVTVPIEPYPPDHNRVQWSSAARVLWQSISDDTPLPGSKPTPHAKLATVPTTAGPALTRSPDKITVRVRNASGVEGLAVQAAGDLRVQGFHIASTGTAPNRTAGVTVGYSSAYAEDARTVAAAFPGATLVKDESAGHSILVTLGKGSPYVVPVPNRVGSTPLPSHGAPGAPGATPSSSVTIKARTADSNICKG